MECFNDEHYYLNRGNELVFTDKYLYNNIDKVLQTPNLTYILINFSDIPVQEEILVRLAEIKTLVKLVLDFIRSDITKIPDAIFSITTLKVLHISNIKTTELQSAIGNLKNLEMLTVIQTQIETVPDSISELTELKTLELEINCITHLPSCIGAMSSLTCINLFLNHLTELPESMGKLFNLVELNLSLMPSLKNIPQSIIDLQDTNQLKIITYEEEDDTDDYWERYEAVKAYFDSLDKNDIIYKNGETLFEACKEIVAKEFGLEEDDREAYLENLKDFAALMYCAQPWFTPPERNDVPLKVVSDD